MLSIIFYKLLYISVVASVIGIAIMFARRFLHKFISPRIIYIMWVVFLFALILPPFISSRVSIYNYIDMSELEQLNFESKADIQPKTVDTQTEAFEDKVQDKKESETIDQSTKPIPSLKDILPIIWILGANGLLFVYLVSNIVFNKKIGNTEFVDNRIQGIFADCRDNFRIRRKIRLINQELVESPAIVGVIKPKILLTEKLRDSSDIEIEYIFRHELAHFKKHDNAINCVLLFLRTIHWFNPIVWVAIREIKKDMEFTADEQAVRGLETDSKKEYCKLLINFSSTSNSSFMEKAIGIANDKNNLEKRINMIKLSDKLSKHPVFATMLVFIIIGLICLILYTNNYYQPKLDVPPKLYIETSDGKVKEMLLTKYEWINGDNVNTYDLEFDADRYEFKTENTIYSIIDHENEIDDNFVLYTIPKYRMSYLNNHSFSKISASGHYDREQYAEYKNLILNVNDVKCERPHLSSEIEMYDVYFGNGSVATYAIKLEDYNFCSREIIGKYLNTKINDKNKIEELVKTMQLGEFLKNVRIENNTLFLNYEYAQDPGYSYNMAVLLFVIIPELDKIEISSNHKDVFYSIDGENCIFSGPLEITRDVANQKAETTIERVQKIIKES